MTTSRSSPEKISGAGRLNLDALARTDHEVLKAAEDLLRKNNPAPHLLDILHRRARYRARVKRARQPGGGGAGD